MIDDDFLAAIAASETPEDAVDICIRRKMAAQDINRCTCPNGPEKFYPDPGEDEFGPSPWCHHCGGC